MVLYGVDLHVAKKQYLTVLSYTNTMPACLGTLASLVATRATVVDLINLPELDRPFYLSE